MEEEFLIEMYRVVSLQSIRIMYNVGICMCPSHDFNALTTRNQELVRRLCAMKVLQHHIHKYLSS